MHGMMRIFHNFKDFYNDINGATLTGAIDVIVVEQPDGSYNCSPFHVRFGKLGVLRSKEKVVDIEINGQPLDIHMKLGESGEAFFVEELECDENDIPDHLATSPIPVSEIENIFLNQGRRRSFQLEDIETLNEENTYSKRRHTADNQLSTNRAQLERDFLKRQIGLGNIDSGPSAEDVTLSLNTISKRSEDDDFSRSQNDISETIFKMDSLDDPPSKAEEPETQNLILTPAKTQDDPMESKSSKKKRKKMRKKNAARKSQSNILSPGLTSTCQTLTLDRTKESNTDRSSLDSNCSERELRDLEVKVEDAEADRMANTSNYKKIEDFHFFSDTELTTSGNADSRVNTPVHIEHIQSDSEIETKCRIKEGEDEPAKSWEWGGFPTSVSQTTTPTTEDPSKEEHKSMLSSMFSFMKSKHGAASHLEGGVYLSDITSGALDREVAEIYFNQKKEEHRNDIDMDCESGNGPSLTESPKSPEGCKSIDSDFEEQTKITQTYSQDISLSLCSWEPLPIKERFESNLVDFSDLCNNPSLFENPNLVVRIKDKYYTWKVAAPIIASMMIYGRPLVQSSVDQLCNAYMPHDNTKDPTSTSKQQEQQRYSWWSWRRSRSSRETTPANDDSIISSTGANGTSDVKDLSKELSVTEEMDEITKSDIKIDIPEESTDTAKKGLNLSNISSQSKISAGSDKCRKTLRLSSKQLASLNLRNGVNEVEFSVTTAYQGTTRCRCNLYKWKWDDKIVISDIDGTITRSDVLGHILPIVGKDWAQSGVAQLFNKIRDNGYKLLYLSARAIGQARITREYLKSIRQGSWDMPDGPILLNPTSLITAFHREVIEKKPEAFKISCMSDIKALFPPDSNPFYAGYGNRINDVWAYTAVGIPIVRIFTINPKGELKHELTRTYTSSYLNMSIIVDQLFPSRLEAASEYSQFNYWKEPIAPVEDLSPL